MSYWTRMHTHKHAHIYPERTGGLPQLRRKIITTITMKRTLTIWQKLQLFYHWILENGDKRTDSWLLVHSPVPISCIFLCYLLIIWVGPKLMAKRQPVNLKPVLIVYNFAMVCLSAYMFYELQFFIVTIHTTYNLFADCDFPDSMNMVVLAYSLSLIALFSNFYYQSYIAKKTGKKA